MFIGGMVVDNIALYCHCENMIDCHRETYLAEVGGSDKYFAATTAKAEMLRLRTNTVRTEHCTLYSSLNVRKTPIATLRFSKNYHHCDNVNTYTLYYTYFCSRLCTLVPGYVLTRMCVCVRALLLNRHLIEWPYCGRTEAVFYL
jgi:hypothetical protein